MNDGMREAKAKVRVARWVRKGRLAELREDAGLSQGDFARALGVSQSSVSRWESGDAVPRARRAADIVELLGGGE
jgi:DNA-binding transcriptional regulator YiaG